jgi:nickel-dependent lactate racemase
MRLSLDYGATGLDVDVPDEGTEIIEPVDVPPAPDPSAELTRAIRNPTGSRPLRDLVRRGQTVGISVCDITRAQPRRLMLEALLEEMPETRLEDVTVFIATGTHRANTPEEIEGMLGAEIARSCRILCHSARDDGALRSMGRTSTGVPILLNREWTEMDVRITTGFVEPHFFAGFSGGPKMVAPGLAGLETVMHLHDAARIGHPRATWGLVEGNPVHDDVREISRRTGVDFALDVTLNRRQQITQAFAGELLAEHREACGVARRNTMRPVRQPFDVVITTNSGYPLDQNLYQTVKGMSAAARVVREGGTILAAAECRDGIPDHGAYMEILRSRDSPRELLDMITSDGYSRPDQWQVQIQAQIQLKARVLLKAGGLTDQQIREAHLEPIHDIGAALAELMGERGGLALCVLPQGPQTIPYVE